MSVGFRFKEIPLLTMPQINYFIGAAVRRIQMDRAVALKTVAIGAQGTGKTIQEELERMVDSRAN